MNSAVRATYAPTLTLMPGDPPEWKLTYTVWIVDAYRRVLALGVGLEQARIVEANFNHGAHQAALEVDAGAEADLLVLQDGIFLMFQLVRSPKHGLMLRPAPLAKPDQTKEELTAIYGQLLEGHAVYGQATGTQKQAPAPRLKRRPLPVVNSGASKNDAAISGQRAKPTTTRKPPRRG